jgi:hypothetical protein
MDIISPEASPEHFLKLLGSILISAKHFNELALIFSFGL